jgi:hypothetical protein
MTRLSRAKTLIKRMLLSDPTLSVASIEEQLDNQGIVTSSSLVARVRSSFRSDLKVLRRTGAFDCRVKSFHSTSSGNRPRVGKRARIESLLRLGIRQIEIAKEMNVSRAYVSQIAKKLKES